MNIGFIGLGDMGSLIVPRLMAAGHRVTGWNRTKAKASGLIDAGMTWADSPKDAATGAEIVFSVVTDGAAVKSVTLGDDGVLAGLAPGAIHIDMSTINPDITREVLGAIGPKVTYIGASGMATTMKISLNLLLMVEIICFGEAVALAEKGGVEREVAVDAILKSVAASPVIGYRGPFVIDGQMPEKPLADVTLQQKDMLLALDLGRKLGSPVPLAAAANELMNACRGLGIDGNDFVVAHEAHLHRNCDEFFIVIKGQGAIRTENGDEPSVEGDVVFSPRGVYHGFANTSDEDVVLVWGWMGAGSIADSGYEVLPESH